MGWDFQEIERDWLAGARVALSPASIVKAFDLVEQLLGPEWIEASRTSSGTTARGSVPTLRVVVIGLQLSALDGVPRAGKLFDRIRRGHQSAEAELTALYLLSQKKRTSIEIYPEVEVASKQRIPDFRIQESDDPWTYVEVTQTDTSEAHTQANTILDRLTSVITRIEKSLALEIFLRREPTGSEIDQIINHIPDFCRLDGANREELPDGLGILLLNYSQPTLVSTEIPPGEQVRPRLGMARSLAGGNEPSRHISVRIPFSDERADKFLKREAQQLPTDSPGLLMIQMSRAPGGFTSWEPLLRRRLQPALNTRVSAICLFSSGFEPVSSGEAWLPETKLIINPHARFQIPTWIHQALTNARSDIEKYVWSA